jgi:hypothetical protein
MLVLLFHRHLINLLGLSHQPLVLVNKCKKKTSGGDKSLMTENFLQELKALSFVTLPDLRACRMHLTNYPLHELPTTRSEKLSFEFQTNRSKIYEESSNHR